MPQARSAGILVLNWNGVELLREHLPSAVATADSYGAPIAVVDNGSTDDSLRFIEKNYPDVRTIKLGANHGFARGYNLAISQVSWDLVVLLNNDMTVQRDFLTHLLAPFDHEESLFAATAQITHRDPTKRYRETGRTCMRFRHGDMDFRNLPVQSEEETDYVAWFGGGSAALSREKFLRLGGFNEILSPFYFEDIDLSYRAWKQGWPTVFLPYCKVIHKYQGSTGRLDPDHVTAIEARNRLLFVWLNLHDRSMWLQHLAFLPIYCLRLVSQVLRRTAGARASLRGVCRALVLAPRIWPNRRANRRVATVNDREIFTLFNQLWEKATLEKVSQALLPQ